MACNNPPCCSCGKWMSRGGSIESLLFHEGHPASYFPFDPAEVDRDEEYPSSGGLRKYRVIPTWNATPYIIPPKYLFAYMRCGKGGSALPNQFRYFYSVGCELYHNDYLFDSRYIKHFYCQYIHADHWWFIVRHNTETYFYDLGTSTPPDDLESLDLSAITPTIIAGTPSGGTTRFSYLTFEALTEAEWTAYENNHLTQWQIYSGNTDTLFGYDQTSVTDPPWSCFVNGTLHYSGVDYDICFYAYGGGWLTASGVGFLSKPVEDLPLLSQFRVDFDMAASDITATLRYGTTDHETLNLGTPWLSDIAFPLHFDMTGTDYVELTEWGDACYGETPINCGGALVPSCILLETNIICEGSDFPAKVYLSRIGDTCEYTSGVISYSGGEFEITATIDEFGMLEFTSDHFFGEHYSFRLQLVNQIYENTTQYINNAVSEGTGDTRYVKSIIIHWLAKGECGDADVDGCPLCIEGSSDTKCIRGQAELSAGGVMNFYMERTGHCVWIGDYIDCLADPIVEYTATLTATVDGCVATFEAVVTKDGSADYVKYRRRYNTNNVGTNCRGSYYLSEYERSGMSELGDAFKMTEGSDEECSESFPTGDYNWPESIEVLKTDETPDASFLVNLFSASEDGTEAVYKDGPFQPYCLFNDTLYTFSEFKITLTRLSDICLQVKAEFTYDDAEAPSGCDFGLAMAGVITIQGVFYIDDYLCFPATHPLTGTIWEIRAAYDTVVCK